MICFMEPAVATPQPTSPSKDPAARARQAAEELAAKGLPVTSRAVARHASVRMTVAAEAARAWHAEIEAAGAIPAVPEAVAGRFDSIWRDAVIAARGEHADDVAGWQARLEEQAEDLAGYAAEIERAESERDALAAELETARKQLRDLEADLATARNGIRAEERKAVEADKRAAVAEATAVALREALAAIEPKGEKK